MQIQKLKTLMNGLNKGTTFAFLSDLRTYKTSHETKYMIVDKGILDLNGAYNVFRPDKELLDNEVLVL